MNYSNLAHRDTPSLHYLLSSSRLVTLRYHETFLKVEGLMVFRSTESPFEVSDDKRTSQFCNRIERFDSHHNLTA